MDIKLRKADMKIKLYITGVMAAATIVANAQNSEDCRCEESFEWLRSTFETNDAGFGYTVERKGRATYDLHNTMTLEKARAAQTSSECTAALGEWLTFFRRGHIGIQLLKADAPAPAAQNPAAEMWTGDIAAFEKEMASRHADFFEGIWDLRVEGAVYKVGIKAEGDDYVCFIIESSEPGWKRGQIRMRITRNGVDWETTYFTRDRWRLESKNPELLGETALCLETGQIFKRVSPALPEDPHIESYVKFLRVRTPYIEQLNPTTLYIRIPSFDLGQKAAIDKIIADNFAALVSTENLIIDVRNNGGGFSVSYEELMPLVYTNPVRTPAMSFLSTPLNIENTEMLLDIEELPEDDKRMFATLVENMKARPGEFVPMENEDVDVESRDTVYEFPRNVGIIVNDGCASATEQFLLAAKQSRKVKLFGTTTGGMLDASNVRQTDSPDGRYRLSYTTSLSKRIPGMAIDDVGLQPDYYLDATIPGHKWVEFVSDILNR
jgi:hypothetical protein